MMTVTTMPDDKKPAARSKRGIRIMLLALLALLILAWSIGLLEKRDAPFPPEGAKLVIEGTFD